MWESQGAYKQFMAWGVPISLAGAGATAGLAAWGGLEAADRGDNHKRNASIAVGGAATSAVVTTLRAFLIKRTVSAAKASGAAGKALAPGIEPTDRWAQCLAVREGWLTGNAEAALIAEKAAQAKEAAAGAKAATEKDIGALRENQGRLVSSIALESALLEHPAVREAAVVGASHPSGSSDIVAFVVLRDPGAVASVRQYALEQIPRAYGLRRIMPVAALPRTHNGKVLKRELRLDMRDHRSTVVY